MSYAWRKRDDTGPDTTAGDTGDADTDAAAHGTTMHETGVHPNRVDAVIQPPAKGPHSERLTLRLNARRTAAVSMALAQQPHVALAALVHRLLAVEFSHYSEASALDINWSDPLHAIQKHASELADDLAFKVHTVQRSTWRGIIPTDSGELLTWCIAQTDERLMLILAQYVAASVNGVVGNEKAHPVNALIPALGLNLADAWQPTRASYFNHVSKARIVEVVSESVSPKEGLRLSKLKKGDAATEAERLMSGRGWLPEHFVRAESRAVRLWNGLHDDRDGDDSQDEDEGEEAGEAGQEAVEDTEAETDVEMDADMDAETGAENEGMPTRD